MLRRCGYLSPALPVTTQRERNTCQCGPGGLFRGHGRGSAVACAGVWVHGRGGGRGEVSS